MGHLQRDSGQPGPFVRVSFWGRDGVPQAYCHTRGESFGWAAWVGAVAEFQDAEGLEHQGRFSNCA